MANPPEDLQKDPLLTTAPSCEGFKVLEPAVLYARIGAGGMGAVYRGRHFSLECDVAVKVLKPDLAHDDQFVARFAREAKLAARISNENVVRVLDVKEKNGIHYLVMEFVQGETARGRVKRKGPLKEQEALAIVLGAALGLRDAHAQGIVHRDIKPDNVLVSTQGAIKLADLGLAKQKQTAGDQNLTVLSSGVMGTPQYMPPEQWRTPDVTPAADVWALGATLWYLLAGKSGIPGGEMLVIAEFTRDHDFPSILTARPDVRPEVAALIAKCTERKPEQRYADARELVKALRPLVSIDDELLRDAEAGLGNSNVAMVTPPPRATLARIKLQVETDPDEVATQAAGGAATMATVPSPGGAATAAAPGPGAGTFAGTAPAAGVPSGGPPPSVPTPGPTPRTGLWLAATLVLLAAVGGGGYAAGWWGKPESSGDASKPSGAQPKADEGAKPSGEAPVKAPDERGDANVGKPSNTGPSNTGNPTLPADPQVTKNSGEPARTEKPPVAATPAQEAQQALARGLEALPRASELDKAIQEFERALQLDGSLAAAKQNLVVALVQKHKQVLASDPDAAFDAAARAGVLAPDDAAVRAAIAAATTAVQQNMRDRITLRAPAAGAVLGDPALRVEGNAAVAKVRSVRVAVDAREGAASQPFPREGAVEATVVGGVFEASVRARGDGPQLVRVEASDVRGPVAEIAPRPIVVDTKPPVLAWGEPSAAKVFAGDLVVTGTVTDDSECTVLVGGAAAAVANGRWRATIRVAAEGETAVAVTARDAAGNEAEPLQRTLRGEPAFTKLAWAEPEPDAKRVLLGDRPYPSVVRDNAAGVRMVLVPAGEFTMGSPADEPERDAEETAHRCVIGQPFWLGETELTQQQWQRVMGNNPSKNRGEQNPVDSVSWEDCQKLVAKLNGAAAAGWRLPSEAEWEYACRAGTTTPFAFGAAIDSSQVNFDGSRPYARGEKSENRARVVPAKSLPANAFGLHEMHGNVHEWCQDAWAPYGASGTEAPVAGNGNPVVRGGAWGSMASGCRSAFRFKGYERYARNERVGLRLARSLDPQ